MNRQDFLIPYLVALYRVHRADPNRGPTISQLKDEFDLPEDNYLESELPDMLSHRSWGHVPDRPSDRSYLDWPLFISMMGKEAAEAQIEGGADVNVRIDIVKSSALVANPKLGIDSTLWTGLPKFGVLTEEGAERLRASLAIVEDAVGKSNATNEEKSQARSYIIAIQALSEAPNPPADLIWEIVQRANNLSGIAALFLTIFSLFHQVV